MTYKIGGTNGGLVNSDSMIDTYMAEQGELNAIAMELAVAGRGPRVITKAQSRVLKRLMAVRARRKRERAAWLRKDAEHQAEVNRLIAALRQARKVAAAPKAVKLMAVTPTRAAARRVMLRKVRKVPAARVVAPPVPWFKRWFR